MRKTPMSRGADAPAGPSLREEQRRLARRKMKDAAREVFMKGNYVDASVDLIAKTAGISRATFYLHYNSKFAVLNELIDEDIERQKHIYLLLTQTPQPTEEDVERWLERVARAQSREQHVVSFWQTAVGLHPELTSRFVAMRDGCIDVLAGTFPAFRWRELSAPADEQRRIRAHLLILEISMLLFHLATATWPMNRRESLRIVAQDILSFIRGEPARG